MLRLISPQGMPSSEVPLGNLEGNGASCHNRGSQGPRWPGPGHSWTHSCDSHQQGLTGSPQPASWLQAQALPARCQGQARVLCMDWELFLCASGIECGLSSAGGVTSSGPGSSGWLPPPRISVQGVVGTSLGRNEAMGLPQAARHRLADGGGVPPPRGSQCPGFTQPTSGTS